MEQCVFVKGKRKLLSQNVICGPSMASKRSSSTTLAFQRFMPAFEQLIDSAISKLYEGVLSEIADFVRGEWRRSSRPRGELATGVVRCANVDGFSLNQSLTKLLGIEPLCISIPPPPLYKIVDTINKNQEPKCVLLKQVECLPAPFLDSLISVLSDSVVDSNLVLLMTISADMSIIYSRCSRESYTRLSIRRFEFPAPTMAMNAFLDAVTFNPHFGLRVDGKLFDELRRNFLERCFSIEQLKKMVRLAVLNFSIANEDLEFDVEEGTLHIERYVLFLHLLYDLCEGLPLQPRFIYDLHSELQSKASFFTDRDGSFWQWKSVWLTWEVEEIIEAINKLLPHVKELDTSLHAELQKLLMDMNDLGRRKSAMSEETASVDSEHSSMVCAPTTKLRSHSAMQQQMRERMALAKKLDPLSSCRQRFVKLLTKIFEIVLKPFDAVGVLSKGLLRGGESLSALTTPRIAERLEESVAGNNLHLKKGWRSQVDLCVAYRTLQNAALYAKNIAIVEWARNFEKHACPMEGVDPSTRLYKCIADLELMGIIKAVSDNCISAVHLLQPPSTLIVDVE